MNEIKDLLDKASYEGLASNEVISYLLQAIALLLNEVEELQAKIEAIESV